jgi:hypothetical protein
MAAVARCHPINGHAVPPLQIEARPAEAEEIEADEVKR